MNINIVPRWRSRSDQSDFAFPKRLLKKRLVNDTVPPSTKYKKWAVNIFAEWQSLREFKVSVLDCGGVFKDYERLQGLRSECRHSCNGRTVAELLVVQIRDGGSEKSGERYPPKSVYGIICSLKRHLEM